ncbi:MAG: Txe/YoeB family addiction module toxin [Candidatus Magnetobacterium sp. LHC-1]|uniref:Txe/YoeB family addiction module toxin n=1 Tax=Candidatus Magnetobacterium casense TaxID=1455061 RepID=A0ABS6RZH5_9BACT|nr:Txe/YoeB family addiction module toxin [Candidatus Magnetobacterium casensis]
MTWQLSIKAKAEDDLNWFRNNDKPLYIKCFDLLTEVAHEPRRGRGKPKRLKYFDREVWSRRINHEHRLVYVIYPDEQLIEVISCRSHYPGF